MAEEEVKYTIPYDNGDPGYQGDIILTYNPSQVGSDGSVVPTAASGTISEIDQNGNVLVQNGVAQTDTVTGVAAPGSVMGGYGNTLNDDKLFLNPTATQQYLDNNGLALNVSGPFSDIGGTVGPNGSIVSGTNEIFYGTVISPVTGNITGYHENGGGSDLSATSFTVTPVCFASGTRIRTGRGDVAVEDLRVGDLAVTTSGELRPITWLGHRTIDCRHHPAPTNVLPVRIAAHAFGAEQPARDLSVSPGHSICVDIVGEVLVPAAVLINGATVTQEEVETVTYWHVELDRHDVMLAENLPCESYLEMGNRSFFAESGVVELAGRPDSSTRTHADFCRPVHAMGMVVEAVRHLLASRANARGAQAPAAPEHHRHAA